MNFTTKIIFLIVDITTVFLALQNNIKHHKKNQITTNEILVTDKTFNYIVKAQIRTITFRCLIQKFNKMKQRNPITTSAFLQT